MVADTVNDAPPSTSDENLNCNFADYSIKHDFRVLNQHVKICNFDVENERFTVFTEIQLFPMKSNVNEICFSLGLYSYLPNDGLGPKGAQITVQGYPATYRRSYLKFEENAQEWSVKSLTALKANLKKAYKKFKGGLVIKIPSQCKKDIIENRVILVRICTNVVKPRQGIKFDFKLDKAGNRVPGGHAFTYRSGVFTSTHEWLPCLDATDQLAIWIIELEVPQDYMALSCGELVNTTLIEERGLKSFVYHLKVPTIAANIGFVIGDLETYTFPDLPDIYGYTLPGMSQILENTISPVPAILTFLEETLAGRFPYNSYKLVFIDNVYDEVISFAGLSVFSINWLHHKRILDVVQAARQVLAHGIATQFFGCLVNATEFADFWVVKALARYVTGLYIERTFGLSEYIYQINRLIESICDHEDKFGSITLRHKDEKSHANLHFDPTCLHTCSGNYADILYKKGQVVMRILEMRLGKDQFLKVLQRIVVIALEYGSHLDKPVDWYHAVISVDSFFNTVTNVTGRELPSFNDLFINNGGHTQFDVQYVPNRKRNTIEVEIRQDIKNKKGCHLYLGPLTINVQELDGYYTHTVQIDSDLSRHDIQCHSKGRKQKRKKVIVSTGEELEIDLSSMDPDSPIMWIRVDPLMQLIRRVNIIQPVYQWEYMLRYERCIVAQLDAIENLLSFPVQQTQTALYDALENDQFFYRVRIRAASYLAEIRNRQPDDLVTQPASVVNFFKSRYGCNSDSRIPVLNNFVATSANLQNYFLMLALPAAISRSRRNNHCPPDDVNFLLGLLKYNDNSINRYSDDHYRAALIGALASTLTAGEFADPNRMDSMDSDVEEIIAEITRILNKDITNPSYSRVVASACLKAILTLQKLNYLPLNLEIFWTFAQSESVFSLLRLTAFSCLISSLSRTQNKSMVENDNIAKLLHQMLNDTNPHIRYFLANQLVTHPLFSHSKDIVEYKSYPANNDTMAGTAWKFVTNLKIEPRLRSIFADAFYVMYSNETPFMLLPEAERIHLEEEQRKNNETSAGMHKL